MSSGVLGRTETPFEADPVVPDDTVDLASAWVNITGSASDDFHKYTLDWSADRLKWLIDDREVRTVYRNETTDQRYFRVSCR